MNCQDFESVMLDVARSTAMDAAARSFVLDHAEACMRCRARLADERALTAGLRAAAAVASSDCAAPEPPARVEAALLAAFRQRNSMRPAAVNSSLTSTPVAPSLYPARSAWARWRVSAAVAAAAIIAALVMAIGFGLSRAPQNAPDKRAQHDGDANNSAPSPGEVFAPVPEITSSKHSNTTAQDEMRKEPARDYPRNMRVQNVALRATSSSRPRSAQTTRKNEARDDARPEVHSAEESADASEAEDVATEFLPLTHGDGFNQAEGGQMVRVELPRSALTSFGLPMNAERSSERVKADVLLGHDGVARAIRFVR